MFDELNKYLMSVKEAGAWNTEEVVQTTRAILDFHMGAVPTEVIVDGKKMTPIQYWKEHLKMDMSKYVNFMSLKEAPYWQKAEYDVPDNWWNSVDYYNVPLDDFMDGLKESLKNGYSISLGGDVSESGYLADKDAAIVPTYDIPSEYIGTMAASLSAR